MELWFKGAQITPWADGTRQPALVGGGAVGRVGHVAGRAAEAEGHRFCLSTIVAQRSKAGIAAKGGAARAVLNQGVEQNILFQSSQKSIIKIRLNLIIKLSEF